MIFSKSSILDVCKVSKSASVKSVFYRGVVPMLLTLYKKSSFTLKIPLVSEKNPQETVDLSAFA